MVGLRGMAEDVPLQKWLNDYIFPLKKSALTLLLFMNKPKSP